MFKYLFCTFGVAFVFLGTVLFTSAISKDAVSQEFAADTVSAFQHRQSGTCEVVCTERGLFYCRAVRRTCI